MTRFSYFVLNCFIHLLRSDYSDASIRFLPTWVIDVTESVAHSLSSDDSEVPELVLDPNAVLMYSAQTIVEVSNDDEEVKENKVTKEINREVHKEVNKEVNGSRSQGGQTVTVSVERHTTHHPQSCHVFDPVLGVIPRETRDLWVQGLHSRSHPVSGVSGGAAVGEGQTVRKLPPVRFSEMGAV